MKLAGVTWTNMNDQEKQKYILMSENDKERFHREKKSEKDRNPGKSITFGSVSPPEI